MHLKEGSRNGKQPIFLWRTRQNRNLKQLEDKDHSRVINSPSSNPHQPPLLPHWVVDCSCGQTISILVFVGVGHRADQSLRNTYLLPRPAVLLSSLRTMIFSSSYSSGLTIQFMGAFTGRPLLQLSPYSRYIFHPVIANVSHSFKVWTCEAFILVGLLKSEGFPGSRFFALVVNFPFF